uniref:hypothetical protein n=1 Tax=Endozoicomonas sp. SESOKO3 TaxID=2828744 RepID=UPI0021481A99
KLEITEAPGEDIVFHGQMPNPDDVAFVETLYKLWAEAGVNNRAPAGITELLKHKIKSYEFVIRSRQMALLEEIVARHDIGVNKDQPTMLSNEDKLAVRSLANYESLQQALALATPNKPYKRQYEFTLEHIRAASSVITQTRMYKQLEEHFGFKPVLKKLLMNPHFLQHIRKVIPVVGDIKQAQIDPEKDEEFTARVMTDMTRQLLELSRNLEKLRAKHARPGTLNEKLIREAATELGIDNWDDIQSSEEQAKIFRKKIHEITQALATTFAATEQPDYGIIMTKLAALENQFGMTPDNENDLVARFQSVQQHIQHKTELADEEAPERLANLESKLGLIPDDEDAPQVRHQAILQHLEQQKALIQQHLLQKTITEAGNAAAIKARYATIAADLNIKNFDTNANVDAQQEQLLQKIKAMDIQKDILLHTMKQMYGQDHSYPEARQNALAEILGIRLSEDSTEENQNVLEKSVFNMFIYLAGFEKKLEDIRTSSLRPKILRKLTAVEKTLNMVDLDSEGDVYYRRNAISEKIQTYLSEARQRAEEEALDVLKTAEEILEIQVSESDNKLERLDRVRIKLEDDDVIEKITEHQYHALWREDTKPADYKKRKGKLEKLLLYSHLTLYVEHADQLAKGRQNLMLQALEDDLGIDRSENAAARERNKALIAKVADNLEVELEKDASVQNQVDALLARISELRFKVFHRYEDEGLSRDTNNEIAHQLNIKDYKNNACVDDQITLIEETLVKLTREIHKVGQPTINERTAVIENELDRQIAQLKLNPRYVLEREVARARLAVKEAKNVLEKTKRDMDAYLQETSDEDDVELNRAMKQFQSELGLSAGDEQSNEERAEDIIKHLLGYSVEIRDEIIKEQEAKTNLHIWINGDPASLEEADYILAVNDHSDTQGRATDEDGVWGELPLTRKKYTQVTEFQREHDRDSSPFLYSPREAKLLTDIKDFMQQHPLKKQAMEAAIGLRVATMESDKGMTFLPAFNFNDEFASIRVQANADDKVTFKQASRIVEVFKSLKTAFPKSPVQPPYGQPEDALDEVDILALKAMDEMKIGSQEFKDEIRAMGKTDIHFVEPETEDLESFPEYFASHSASGNKIIALLREGAISKVELENYLKAIRGVDGYQTVDEFEHFLGYKHAVNVPRFKVVVRALSDEGAEQFMRIAFAPVTVTATCPAGMKESVADMKEYAAAIIANYVLDDIAFENGRRSAAFLANVQDTLAPYANAVGLSESELIQAIHDTLKQAHAAAVEQQLNDYWAKPSAFLLQAVTWYYSSYKPLLVTHTTLKAGLLSLSNMWLLYLLDLTNRGDYTHRMRIPFQHWLEHYSFDLDRTQHYKFHSEIEQLAELGGLAMPFGKAASSVVLLKTGSMLFARQHNANPRMYRSISRLVPEIVASMSSGQGVQVPLLHRVTPQKIKTLASATAGLVLGPVATVGAYAHGLISGFTYAQTFGFALASSLTYDFFMNDNKMLTQWLGGPLGRSLDKINRWTGVGETESDYVKRTAIASPQRFNETDEAYANHVKASNIMPGWTRHENYLQFRERRDRTMKMFENSWEKYFRDNVPKWSFSHAESIPDSYTLGALFESRAAAADENPAAVKAARTDLEVEKLHLDKDKNTRHEL